MQRRYGRITIHATADMPEGLGYCRSRKFVTTANVKIGFCGVLRIEEKCNEHFIECREREKEVMEAHDRLACALVKFNVNSRYIGYRKIKQFYPIMFYDFST